MLEDGIADEEVKLCLECGEQKTQGFNKGEPRYIRILTVKDRKIVVVYTFKNKEPRVITVYAMRSKKWQN